MFATEEKNGRKKEEIKKLTNGQKEQNSTMQSAMKERKA